MSGTIGIMGGTFNPVHKGHIGIARCAYEQYAMDKVIFMPSGSPAYKDNSDIVDAAFRCDMVRLAIEPYDYMDISTIEVERSGNTYTADTLRQLRDTYQKIYFIVGADSLMYIEKWHDPEYICGHCHLLCAGRCTSTDDELVEKKRYLWEHFGAKIDFIESPDFPMSSTDIRRRVRAGEDITVDVGQAVADYIREHGLYR